MDPSKTLLPNNLCQGALQVKGVSELLDINGNWDVAAVRQWFPLDADVILKIKNSVRNEDDFIAWAGEKTGIFSVRSAYRIAFEEMNQLNQSSFSNSPNRERRAWSAT